jgi:hypothetical protein
MIQFSALRDAIILWSRDTTCHFGTFFLGPGFDISRAEVKIVLTKKKNPKILLLP